MSTTALFVTGMQRSGTTLLEKLLAAHPGISLLSQPFPFLFLEAKRAFFRKSGWDPPAYPLGHLFLEGRYGPEGFAGFLRGWRVDAALLREVLAAMEGFPGQYTRFSRARLDAALDGLIPGELAEALAQLWRSLSGRPQAGLFGGKETICEELLPSLLDRGCRCVLILRDPRDVLASLNHGRGRDYGGRLKPTLFNLRNWRKSVAFALHCESHPGFAWIRYEDLVARPVEALNRVTPGLGIAPFTEELLSHGIRDEDGRPWSGNSSHSELSGVSGSSVGLYREILPPGVAQFVEAACHPELVRLGYPVSLSREEIPEVLRSFEDPYPVERGDLPEAADPARAAAQELRRLEILARPATGATRPWFLFQDVHDALRQAVFEP